MSITPDDIDALLPQTQCGLCGYGGCMPYAEAIVFENAAINLCPPGGVATLNALALKLNQDASLYVDEMQQKAKPKLLARIKENECIGCTKCIKACPVDAIIGSAKQMHVIISDHCTGCELCIPPCPVDCIQMLIVSSENIQSSQEQRDANRLRYNKREKRLAKEKKEKKLLRINLLKKKNYIQAAIERVKEKKTSKL